MIGELAVMSRVAGSTKTYVDDVFSAYTYTGNGATQTITNGIDLAGKGGAVWIKSRDVARNHLLSCPTGTDSDYLVVNATDAKAYDPSRVSAFTSAGFSVGSSTGTNGNAEKYVSWTFCKAPKFFDVVTYTGNGGANRTIAHSLGVAPGMIIIKATSRSGDSWAAYHRSAAKSGYTAKESYLILNSTQQVEGPYSGYWNNTDPTSTVFTVGSDGWVNANGVSYVAYLFAHDTATDGIIQCGSFTTDGSGNATVNLGWEPQYLMVKKTGAVSGWYVYDTMRGFVAPGANNQVLFANLSDAEAASALGIRVSSTGLAVSSLNPTETWAYLAIRRPNKPPTTGTQVYAPVARTGTSSVVSVTTPAFAPDLLFSRDRNSSIAKFSFNDRLRGASQSLYSTDTAAEATTTGLTSFDNLGYTAPSDGLSYNESGDPIITECFRRAPGVFDEVCYTGDDASSRNVSHSLGVTPELVIYKCRSNTSTSWHVYSASLGVTKSIFLNTTAAEATNVSLGSSDWGAATATTFSADVAAVNQSPRTYVAYLFATIAGISKVGSYTGNGTSQTINCGFATGARFILIKRTDSTGDWYVWDTVRGIIASDDPHLSLNTTAAEVTTDDSIDPDTSGFIVNQLAATNINVTSATYIFLAIA